MDKQKNRLERKKINTKEKIFNAAIKLFQKKGYNNTTVDEIVEKADVAKGTFFNYFPTKSALLNYFYRERMYSLKKIVEQELAKGTFATKEKIIKLVEIIAHYYETNSELAQLVIYESLKNYGDFIQDDKVNQYLIIQFLENIIEEGKKTGDIQYQANSKETAEILYGTYLFSILLWVYNNEYPLKNDMLSKIKLLLDRLL